MMLAGASHLGGPNPNSSDLTRSDFPVWAFFAGRRHHSLAQPGAGHGANGWRRPFAAKEHPTTRRVLGFMHSRAEDYYCRGLEAQQHAAQEAELRFKKAFEQVADNWFTLAEQAQWLEHYSRPQYGRPTPKEPEAS